MGAFNASCGHLLFSSHTAIRAALLKYTPDLVVPVSLFSKGHTIQNKIEILFLESVSHMVWLLITWHQFLLFLLCPFHSCQSSGLCFLQAYFYLRALSLLLPRNTVFFWCSQVHCFICFSRAFASLSSPQRSLFWSAQDSTHLQLFLIFYSWHSERIRYIFIYIYLFIECLPPRLECTSCVDKTLPLSY